MNSLDKYILRQFLLPFTLIIAVLTLVLWMTQSLQRVDILIENGKGIGLFLYISVLVIPSLLVILIPFALFGACLYALYRMHSDSELAVMFAAGVSRLRLALPILSLTFFGALATLYVALDLSPRTYRALKKNIIDIRTDLAGSVLRSGEFITVIDGFTIYVEEVLPRNRFIGILINDYRKPGEKRTIMAQKGAILTSDIGPVLLLRNGIIQRLGEGSGDVDMLPFDETSISIASLQSDDEVQLELTERYLSELLQPDLSKEWERRNQGKLFAEAHARLASPFHAFSYVMVALYALIGGAYSRQRYLLRIVLAAGAVVGLRVGSYLIQSMAAQTGMQWVQYALPIVITLGLLYLMADKADHWGRRPRQLGLKADRPSLVEEQS